MRLWDANKNVGAHSICARKACAAVYIPGGYGIRPYGCFERSASDAIHHIYYFLFIIFYLQSRRFCLCTFTQARTLS